MKITNKHCPSCDKVLYRKDLFNKFCTDCGTLLPKDIRY